MHAGRLLAKTDLLKTHIIYNIHSHEDHACNIRTRTDIVNIFAALGSVSKAAVCAVSPSQGKLFKHTRDFQGMAPTSSELCTPVFPEKRMSEPGFEN